MTDTRRVRGHLEKTGHMLEIPAEGLGRQGSRVLSWLPDLFSCVCTCTRSVCKSSFGGAPRNRVRLEMREIKRSLSRFHSPAFRHSCSSQNAFMTGRPVSQPQLPSHLGLDHFWGASSFYARWGVQQYRWPLPTGSGWPSRCDDQMSPSAARTLLPPQTHATLRATAQYSKSTSK